MLAHPFFGDGGQHLGAEQLRLRVDRLCGMGLSGLECFYPVNTPEQTQAGLDMAEERGLFVTAGSDFHGKNKTNRMGVTGFPAEREMPAGMVRFLERCLLRQER